MSLITGYHENYCTNKQAIPKLFPHIGDLSNTLVLDSLQWTCLTYLVNTATPIQVEVCILRKVLKCSLAKGKVFFLHFHILLTLHDYYTQQSGYRTLNFVLDKHVSIYRWTLCALINNG